MNSDRWPLVVLILALMAASFIIGESQKRTPVPVEVTQPEQSHYAVFYVVCGVLQHVLVTTNPPFSHSMAMVPSQELLDLLRAVPEEQMIELTYEGPECFYSERPAPEKPIL